MKWCFCYNEIDNSYNVISIKSQKHLPRVYAEDGLFVMFLWKYKMITRRMIS